MSPVSLDAAQIPDEFRLLQTIEAVEGRAVAAIDSAIRTISDRQRNSQRKLISIAAMAGLLICVALWFGVDQFSDSVNISKRAGDSWQQLMIAATQDEFVDVEREFRLLLDESPDSALAFAGMCMSSLRLFDLTRRDSDLVRAQSSCDSAMALDSGLSAVQDASGWLANYTGDPQLAEQYFSKSVAIEAKRGSALLGLALSLEAQGKSESAETAYVDAAISQPDSWRVHNSMAVFLQKQGRIDESIRKFEFASKIAPENIAVLNNLGVSHLFAENYPAAIAAWTDVLNVTPQSEHGPTLTNIGSAYYLLGELASAKAAFERATRLMGDEFRSWSNLADTQLAMAETSEAADSYRRALDRIEILMQNNQDDDVLVASKASFLSALGDERWRTVATPLLADVVNDPEVARILSLCYIRDGNVERADVYFERAIALGYPRFLLESDVQFDKLKSETP